MTPVSQDKFEKTFKHGGGNCLQACVASWLDLPLEAVPHFMIFGNLYWEAFILYFRSQGYEVLGWVEGVPPNDGNYYIVSAEVGSRDYNHAVIARNGKVVHDPHPVKINDKIIGYYSITPKQ
jgi:hypothetical protein